ncbi:acetylglutamate kinase [Flaviaesturariibacter aridisoli]|uniref:Acetylglutamate kinase n=1 Tax=Flaviaesturariibacter aridisoli TaxID=2545761 RepID=A0A4V2WMV4_9BACT|nr:acetylglutamate kinase [Flaviaesturariibacter aridisoli]TCZ72982.1 acetylglutamate kinase [Flaviaesturariibacter aridisoli]
MKELTVIKIGGNIIDDEERLHGFLLRFAAVAGAKVLVHGGGKLATRLAGELKIQQQLVDGRRITDAETLKVVTMVYAGWVNKSIVAGLQALGCPAIGLSGADGDAVRAQKRQASAIDYGFVGDVTAINAPFLHTLIEAGQTLVLAPITHDGNGQLLNTNADTIAQETATALGALYSVRLVYSFEKAGVLRDADDDQSVISEINPERYATLKADGIVSGGMLPKLDNAFRALAAGVQEVIIGQAEALPALLSGQSGTRIHHG